ncbi:MAG: hypothetical protein GY793_09945 [Proteobacteria bacterium]|nr:hypothetical protein [Pseudomonadota bacterium]
MKKLIIMLILLTASINANAFYTDLNNDLTRLKEGINTQHQLTPDQKKQVFGQYSQMIKTERAKAYTKIARGCKEDVINFCTKKNERSSIDQMVKCLSQNKSRLSHKCTTGVADNFRKD